MMNHRRLTLKDVAERAGVSRATASLVLRDSPLVAPETRDKVRAAVAELGYIYHRGAANLRARSSKTIALVVPNLANPYFAEMALGVDTVMDAAGYVSFLVSTGESLERQDRFLRRMREQGVDGVVLCPAAGTTAHQLHGTGLICVQAMRFVAGRKGEPDTDYAGIDYRMGIEQAVEHLIRRGHRNIAFVGGERTHSAQRERLTGYTAGMRRHGLDETLVLRTPLTRRAGADAVAALLAQPARPTAAICFNDIVALGLMLGLQRHGLRAGKDMAVIGVDDLPESELADPALTTVATLPRLVGEESARLLLRRIQNPGRGIERVILPARLVIRASCGETPERIAL